MALGVLFPDCIQNKALVSERYYRFTGQSNRLVFPLPPLILLNKSAGWL